MWRLPRPGVCLMRRWHVMGNFRRVTWHVCIYERALLPLHRVQNEPVPQHFTGSVVQFTGFRFHRCMACQGMGKASWKYHRRRHLRYHHHELARRCTVRWITNGFDSSLHISSRSSSKSSCDNMIWTTNFALIAYNASPISIMQQIKNSKKNSTIKYKSKTIALHYVLAILLLARQVITPSQEPLPALHKSTASWATAPSALVREYPGTWGRGGKEEEKWEWWSWGE